MRYGGGLCVAIGLLASSIHAAVPVQKVALTQEVAAGTGGKQWYELSETPALDESGQVMFLATYHSGNLSSNEAIWRGTPGSLSIVAHEGSPVPDGPAGRNFATSDGGSVFHTTLARSGRPVFHGNYRDNDGPLTAGNWMHGPGGFGIISYSGMPAPSLGPGATILSVGASPRTTSNGHYAFSGILTVGAGGVTDANAQGVWANRGNGLELIARQGDQALGAPTGVTYATGWRPAISASGVGAFSTFWSDNTSALYRFADSGVSLVARQGVQAPGQPAGRTFASVDVGRMNERGDLAFYANLQGSGINASNNSSVWISDAGGLRLVARPGMGAPGGGTLTELYIPDIADDGRVIFLATTSAGRGLFTSTSQGLESIVRTGTPAPGMPAGYTIDQIFSPTVNLLGQVAFEADVKDAMGNLYYGNIFATDTTGTLHHVAGRGTTFQISPGIFGEILRTELYSRQFQDVVLSQFNEAGQLVFFGATVDGRGGIFLATIPEPAALLLLVPACCSVARRRRRR